MQFADEVTRVKSFILFWGKFNMFLHDESSSLVPVFVVVVMLSPISTFSIEQSRKNGFKGAFQVYKVKVAQI